MGATFSREEKGRPTANELLVEPIHLRHCRSNNKDGGLSSLNSSRSPLLLLPSSSSSSSALSTILFATASRTRCEESKVAPPLPPSLPESSNMDAGQQQQTAPPPPPETPDAISAAAQQVSAFPNPGPLEQATMDIKRLVTLDTFDGFRCDINKQVSPFMAAVHSFWLGTGMIPDGRKNTYTFLTQVADEKGLLMARVDPSRWSVDGRIHRAVLGGLAMGKVQISVSPPDGGSGSAGDQLLAELDFGGLTWTGNLKYGSMGGGIVYGCNYFQAITPRLAMGGEGMYIGANQNLLGNYLIKYTMPAKTDDEVLLVPAVNTSSSLAPAGVGGASLLESPGGGSSTFCCGYNAGQGAATVSYRRVVTPNRVQLASELQFSPFSLESKLLLGAEFKLSRSRIALCLDANDGRIQTLIEAKLGIAPGSPTLNFSADVNHLEEDLRFGYGINIEG